MIDKRLETLYKAYLDNHISVEEKRELWELWADPRNEQQVKALMDAYYDSGKIEFQQPDNLASKMFLAITSSPDQSAAVRRLSFFRTAWFRYAAAVLLLVGAGAYLWNNNNNTSHKKQAVTLQPEPPPDASPGGDKAILTLADGSTIVLDSASNGQLARQSGVKIVKNADGQLEYRMLNQDPATVKEVTYNTMRTPKGGQYQLVLQDGTKVWLNAASSITFPTVFTGNERKVSITGEAYLEVAKDKTKPFKATVGDHNTIEVLGTHFNVNAYADEEAVRTTLLEGSVRIDNTILKPGEAYSGGKIMIADIDQTIAWKNGVFNFHHLKLESIMRQISRWYDIEVVYENNIPKTEFFGELGRDLQLSQVLNALKSSDVHFRIEKGKKIIVLP